MLTPYQFASNTPIQAIDLDGLEALIATDYLTLENLKSAIDVKYSSGGKNEETKTVTLIHHSHSGSSITESLSSNGARERNLRPLQERMTLEGVIGAIKTDPKLLHYGGSLRILYSLTKERSPIGGRETTATGAIAHMLTNSVIENHRNKDLSSKGFWNTALHFGGQALAAAIYGKTTAKLVADVHERGQPSLMTGDFTDSEKTQAIDNYIDLINNAWGREFGQDFSGNLLRSANGYPKFNNEITQDFINGLQDYFSETFDFEFNSFKVDEKGNYNIWIIGLTNRLNEVLPNGE